MRRLTASQHGLTLIELMVALAIGAILALAGVPYYGEYINNSRLREAGNALYAEALFAQSEAVKRNGVVRLSINGSALEVSDRTAEGGQAVIRSRTLPEGVAADTAVDMDFGSRGRPAKLGDSYTVTLGKTGVTCSSAQRCPALRVEAGGPVRLCGDKSNCS